MYYVRLMYDLVDVRWTFVLFYLRKSFVLRTLGFRLSALDCVDDYIDDPSDDGDDEALLIAGRRCRGRLFHGRFVL